MIGPLAFLPLAQTQALRPPDQASVVGNTPEWVLLAVLVCVFIILVRRTRRQKGTTPAAPDSQSRLSKLLKSRRDRNWILVDGSNVMHWEDNTPQIEPVRRVVTALKERGLDPGVVFDANAGWKLAGRYMGERELCQLLDLPQDQVLVVPKGSPADPWLLTTAREFGARIVTNDHFRDWAADHPDISRPGFLVHGGLTGTSVWLEGMTDPEAPQGA
jgi:hypothetical protein